MIGNPLIADLSIQPGGLAVITGKSYGATNFLIMDKSGAVLTEQNVEVEGPTDKIVVVYRGVDRNTYSCTPECAAAAHARRRAEVLHRYACPRSRTRNTQALGRPAPARAERERAKVDEALRPVAAFAAFATIYRQLLPGNASHRGSAPPRGAHWVRVSMFEQLKSEISARAVRLLRSPLLRRFISHRKAATTVEFGLLAAPFLALIFAILQTAILFFAGQALETAAATSARLILTGQAQTQGWTAAQFKQQVCNTITGLFNCQSGVYVDVETYSSFAAVNLGMPVSNGNFQRLEPRLQSRRSGRHRGCAALLPVSGLHQSARLQPERS